MAALGNAELIDWLKRNPELTNAEAREEAIEQVLILPDGPIKSLFILLVLSWCFDRKQADEFLERLEED